MVASMAGVTLSLIVGFSLACSAVWLVSRINNRYTQHEKNLSRVLARRGKKQRFFTGILAAEREPEAMGEPRRRKSRVRYELKRIAGEEHPVAGGGTRI
jgi:hypothetical protein